MSYGFYDQLVLPIIFNVDESFVSGQDFILEIDFLICEIICIPESAKLSFNINEFNNEYGFGLGIHEMGTARMGRDPKTSVLNKHNQVHSVSNLFVTDGACMTSSANQNPSLTYMALTARAANHAISELKKRNI